MNNNRLRHRRTRGPMLFSRVRNCLIIDEETRGNSRQSASQVCNEERRATPEANDQDNVRSDCSAIVPLIAKRKKRKEDKSDVKFRCLRVHLELFQSNSKNVP